MVATSFGVVLAIYPDLAYPGLLCLCVRGVLTSITRMSSVGSMAAGLAFPVMYSAFALGGSRTFTIHWPFPIFTCMTAAMIVLRHWENLGRIAAGTESRFGLANGSNPRPARETSGTSDQPVKSM